MIREIGVDTGSYTFDKVAKTITLAGIPTIDQSQIILITHAPTSTVIYNFADGAATGGSYVPATGVLTLTYNTNTGSFTNTDPLRILVDNMDMDGYDAGLDIEKVVDQSPLRTRRTDPEAIIASAYTLTSTFVAVGPVLSMASYNKGGLFTKCTIQNSIGVQVQIKGLRSYADTQEYPLCIESVTTMATNITPEIIQFPDANFILPIKIITDGIYPFIKIYMRDSAMAGGSTHGTIDTLDISKSW